MAKRSKAAATEASGSVVRIPAGEFKAKCLQIMDDVQAKRRTVVITKYGKAVARLVPADDEVPDSYGALRGTVRYRRDIVAPDHESWDEAPS